MDGDFRKVVALEIMLSSCFATNMANSPGIDTNRAYAQQ